MDNKTFSELLCSKLGKDKEEISELIGGLSRCLGDVASELDAFTVPGFGNFEPRKRMERIMVQPSTGKKLLVPPKVVLGFKPSAVLKQKVRDREQKGLNN